MIRRRAILRWYLFLLAFSCLASVVAAVHIAWYKGISVWSTSAISVALASLCVSLFVRWWVLPQSCRPPWQRFGRRVRRDNTIRVTTRIWTYWQFTRSWVQQHCYHTLPPPKVLHGAPQQHSKPVSTQQIRHDYIKPSPFRIHLASPTASSGQNTLEPEHFQHQQQSIQWAFHEIVPDQPALLALQVQPRRTVWQFAETPQLRAAEQRSVIQRLQADGLRANWSRATYLDISTRSSDTERAADRVDSPIRWLPVLRDHQSVLWWPLAQNQHVVFAGAVGAQITTLVRRIEQLPDNERPEMLVYDPDGYLQSLDKTCAHLTHYDNAFAEARTRQLAQRFTVARDHTASTTPTTMCLVVNPAEAIWPDLQPLLAAESGVQVLLVFAHRPPFASLRAACHRLWVIEVPDLGHPALPDTFRPASVPPSRYGEVLAWSSAGQVVWRGFPLNEQNVARRVRFRKERVF